jgi:hypothetical protein
MGKTTFFVTTWTPHGEAAAKIVRLLNGSGIESSDIQLLTERVSRPKSLNRAISGCRTPYVGFLEDDVNFSPGTPGILELDLDADPSIGLAVAPVTQLAGTEPGLMPQPAMALDAAGAFLVECSSRMWTLNFAVYRKDVGVPFDESYFGNQVFDWDFGLELLLRGYRSMADLRTAVTHRQTDYSRKSLSYHAMVARNRHIFVEKWRNRGSWKGIPPCVPSVEELTHAGEAEQMRYVARFDSPGLHNHYLAPRFGSQASFDRFLGSFPRDVPDEFRVMVREAGTLPDVG